MIFLHIYESFVVCPVVLYITLIAIYTMMWRTALCVQSYVLRVTRTLFNLAVGKSDEHTKTQSGSLTQKVTHKYIVWIVAGKKKTAYENWVDRAS